MELDPERDRTVLGRQRDVAGPDRCRIALRCGGLLALLALTGCGPGILPSQGVVGKGNTTIMIDSLAIMLAIVVPTIVATLAFAWWFRSSNSSARYRPDFIYSGQIEMVTWSIPLMTIMLLGGVAWRGSHDLDPARPLPSDEAPLKIQAVSLDWKWLFIYPDHNIATVNRLVIPAGTPVHFTLTSASVMNAFFVPKLGSMIYTMNRMETQLHLNADQPGTFLGMSSHFSGDGFADMQFNVQALPKDGFSAWIDETRNGATATLTSQIYQDLAKQGMKVYMTENIVSHWLGDRSLNGREAWREAMAKFFDAFPDAGYTLNDVFCTGDKGVWRGTWNATQRKEWEGIPETGRKAKWTVIIIGRFEGDKLAEDWVEHDRYNLFRQLEPH